MVTLNDPITLLDAMQFYAFAVALGWSTVFMWFLVVSIVNVVR